MIDLFIFRPTLGQGGADRVTLTLLESLDRTMFRPSLVLVKASGEFLADVPEDVKVYTLGSRNLRSAWRPLARLLRAHRPDVLFSTSSGANVIAIISHLLARSRGRLVLSERNILVRGKPSLKRDATLRLKRALYGRADHITSVSQGVKDDLVSTLGLPEKQVTVVYNPIVTDALPRLAAERVEHEWFADDVPVILGVGRFVAQKDFGLLIDAFARVRAARRARLIILGEGELRAEMLARVERLGLSEDVWFPGFDKNPFKYMSKCAVFVLSSRHEGLPGALIQAMACGAAVVSTDCPSGPSEIITPGVDGYLVPVGDGEALANRIGELIDDPALRRKMGERGRASALRYKTETVMNNYIISLLGDERAGRKS